MGLLISKFRNPWYNPRIPGSRQYYTSTKESEEYRGFYLVTDANPWVDVVENVDDEFWCVSQRGSIRNAKAFIDSQYEKPEE